MSAREACPDCGGLGWGWTHFAPDMGAFAPPKRTTCWPCSGTGRVRLVEDWADQVIQELSALRERGA